VRQPRPEAGATTEREQAIGAMLRALALEREQLLHDVDAQRRATLVWWASANSVILALANSEHRQYDVPPGLKEAGPIKATSGFDVEAR
jgi:hypothetical protein